MGLIVLSLITGIGFASYALWQKARRDETEAQAAEKKRLQAPAERSPTTIQVGDVVQHLGSDFVVEGIVTLSEDGRGARLYRMFDGSGERFLLAKSGGGEPLLLAGATVAFDGDPPEALAHAGGAYRLTARMQASAIRVGQLGARKPSDRMRLFEYAGPGPARLLLVDWGERIEALTGERVLAHALEILPGR